jgi:hypothetical protein
MIYFHSRVSLGGFVFGRTRRYLGNCAEFPFRRLGWERYLSPLMPCKILKVLN